MWRVIQVMETGEECYRFTGTLTACDRWIEQNAVDYPESRFYTEPVQCRGGYCE